MRKHIWSTLFVVMGLISCVSATTWSSATDDCITCHSIVHPGIVADWQQSRHAMRTPADALLENKLARRISTETISEKYLNTTIGCAECHTANSESHADAFEHNGYQVHVVVSPNDCALCHHTEVSQYSNNLMSRARTNLLGNPVYHTLVNAVNGVQQFDGNTTTLMPPDDVTNQESCIYCHGTEVTVTGTHTLDTDFGEMDFPVLAGWPSQGTGRINPDGSEGSCTPCHTRHRFSIAMARKPSTCSECHKGPDVPAYSVYQVSKHGNLYYSLGDDWNFDQVPWVVGDDFTAPTCATCHTSLITSPDGELVAERTHRMNDRSPWRIFGLIYAHPHPKTPNTNTIVNQAGLPLPTELTGEPAAAYVIDESEQDIRRNRMKKICTSCHSVGWVDGQFDRFEHTIETTNQMTLTATQILSECWDKDLAQGLPHGADIFDEAIEKKWVEQWLFYANSTRFASAMAGADYGAFANGRWHMSKNIQDMLDWLKTNNK